MKMAAGVKERDLQRLKSRCDAGGGCDELQIPGWAEQGRARIGFIDTRGGRERKRGKETQTTFCNFDLLIFVNIQLGCVPEIPEFDGADP